MNRTLLFFIIYICNGLISLSTSCAQSPDQLLLSHYRPQSSYKIPVSQISKSAFLAIDMHSHAYANTKDELDQWVQNMDKYGIQKTIILSGATGSEFDSIYNFYKLYPDRFDIWCGIDFTNSKDKNWSQRAINELQRCKAIGAKGIGEITEKGAGLYSAFYSKSDKMYIDDPKMEPIWDEIGKLKMPINIHIAEPIWMFESQDSTNDGLMNAYIWKIPDTVLHYYNHQKLIDAFGKVVASHPKIQFIACHFLNCSYDLSIVGNMLDKYPNLMIDNSARYAETAPIPRHTAAFYKKYKSRIFFGTDMGFDSAMYEMVFRILESADEHFYDIEQFGYHWPLYGLNLPKKVLKKVYYSNAKQYLNAIK